jgi:hypothetical protein
LADVDVVVAATVVDDVATAKTVLELSTTTVAMMTMIVYHKMILQQIRILKD